MRAHTPMMPSCGSSTSPLPVMVRLCLASATTMTACVAVGKEFSQELQRRRRQQACSHIQLAQELVCSPLLGQLHRGTCQLPYRKGERSGALKHVQHTCMPAPLAWMLLKLHLQSFKEGEGICCGTCKPRARCTQLSGFQAIHSSAALDEATGQEVLVRQCCDAHMQHECQSQQDNAPPAKPPMTLSPSFRTFLTFGLITSLPLVTCPSAITTTWTVPRPKLCRLSAQHAE